MIIFWLLLIAHIIADFIQPIKLLEWRKSKPWGIELHSLIYTVLSAFMLYGFMDSWLQIALILGIIHLIIDRVKLKFQNLYKKPSVAAFVVDQFLHILSISLVVKFADLFSNEYFYGIGEKHISYMAGYLLVSLAGSILIFETERTINQPKNTNQAYIGWRPRIMGMAERIIGFALLISGKYILLTPIAFVPSIFIDKSKDKNNLIVKQLTSFIFVVLVGVFFKSVN